MRRAAALALVMAVGLWAGQAGAACRQALAIGLDVSGSVDRREYRLQIDGLAAALVAPQVQQAFLAMPGAHVSLAIYEWSGPGAQRVLLEWQEITDARTLDEVAARLRKTSRSAMDLSTALGEAKLFGAGLLTQRPACWRQILDLTGDGKSNGGPRPQDVRGGPATVNALVIGEPEQPGREGPGLGELVGYFRAYVIEGQDAFVETALGFDAFEAAMTRKLLRELQVLVIGAH